MYWRINTCKTYGLAYILIGLALSAGCSTGKNSNNHHDQTVASLTQQGHFTKAALLDSLQNSAYTSDTKREGVIAPTSSTESEPRIEDQQEIEKVLQLESTEEAHPSPLLVHLPPESSSETTLDEKWHIKLGWSLLIDGNYAGAAAAYREAIRHDRDSAEAYLGLGSSLKMQNHIPAAIEAYQHVLRLQPDYTAALVHLGSIYADGDPEHRNVAEAKQLYARASQQGDPFAKMALKELKARQ